MLPMKLPPSSRWTRECHPPRDFLGILKILNLTSLSRRLLSLLYMPTSWFPMVVLCLFFIDPVKVQKYEDEDFDPNFPKSSHTENDVHPANTSDCSSMRKCRKLSKKVLQKYLSFFKPLYQRIRGHRSSSSKPENVGRRSKSMKNWEYSHEASPRISVAYSADDWRRSCDSESSIYEAVLHCKKSIGRWDRVISDENQEKEVKAERMIINKRAIQDRQTKKRKMRHEMITSTKLFVPFFYFFLDSNVPYHFVCEESRSCINE